MCCRVVLVLGKRVEGLMQGIPLVEVKMDEGKIGRRRGCKGSEGAKVAAGASLTWTARRRSWLPQDLLRGWCTKVVVVSIRGQ